MPAPTLRRAVTACAAACVVTTPCFAQSGSSIHGRILTSAGQPIAGALVIRRSPVVDTARADSAGRYVVARLAQGRHIFLVQHAGFQPMEMEVSFPNDTTLEVDVPLDAAPAAASPAAIGLKLDSVGFTERRGRLRGRSNVSFVSAEDIVSRNARHVTDLFDQVRDVRVINTGRVKSVIGDSEHCYMPIWIEGQQELAIYPNTARGIDDVVPVERVAGIEVYPRDTEIPARFAHPTSPSMPYNAASSSGRVGVIRYETRTVHCGAVVIWLK